MRGDNRSFWATPKQYDEIQNGSRYRRREKKQVNNDPQYQYQTAKEEYATNRSAPGRSPRIVSSSDNVSLSIKSRLGPRVQPSPGEETYSLNRQEDKETMDLQKAAQIFAQWLPSLSNELCASCIQVLQDRVNDLASGNIVADRLDFCVSHGENSAEDNFVGQKFDEKSNESTQGHTTVEDSEFYKESEWTSESYDNGRPTSSSDTQWIQRWSPSHHSWADMVQEEEMEETSKQDLGGSDEAESAATDVENSSRKEQKRVLSRDEREYIRFMQVGRKKDFVCLERINGKLINILEALELHTCVFSAAEQKRMIDFIYELQERGRKKQLRERTYSEPRKWMRGKGRVTIQFGCCYNYAVVRHVVHELQCYVYDVLIYLFRLLINIFVVQDKNGNPPGIIRDEDVDPIPHLFKLAIRRLVKWHVLPPTCVPDSCIVNIYEEGDCIPPHIDHHDFVRPFCTVSLLSECNIVFGSNLRILGPGVFQGAIAIPLPVGVSSYFKWKWG
eukprot:Gb_01413 [translate_table: standard]